MLESSGTPRKLVLHVAICSLPQYDVDKGVSPETECMGPLNLGLLNYDRNTPLFMKAYEATDILSR